MIVSSIEGRDPARWAPPSSLGRPVPGPSALSADDPRFHQDAVAGHSSAGVVPPGSTPARARVRDKPRASGASSGPGAAPWPSGRRRVAVRAAMTSPHGRHGAPPGHRARIPRIGRTASVAGGRTTAAGPGPGSVVSWSRPSSSAPFQHLHSRLPGSLRRISLRWTGLRPGAMPARGRCRRTGAHPHAGSRVSETRRGAFSSAVATNRR